MKIYTVGHSSRTLQEFLTLLKDYRIDALVDIRRVPGSKKFPHFASEALKQSLSKEEIDYLHFEGLGGQRTKITDNSPNSGWKVPGFQYYADYMATKPFQDAVGKLLKLAKQKQIAIMCAEKLYFKCHRQLVADYFVAHRHEVIHLEDLKINQPHKLTSFARIQGGKIIYPSAPQLF